MKVPYLSASRLKMAKNCAFQYGKRYDPGSTDDTTLRRKNDHRDNLQAARVGTNIHNALEEWRRPNPKTGKVRRPLLKKLLELYDQECVKNEIDFQAYEDGKAMILRWFDQRGVSKAKIVDVERAFGSHKAPWVLDNGTPVFGFIDLIVEHQDGSIELIDYKSQRAPITQTEADHDIQAGIYLTVAREVWPDRQISFTFDLLRYGTVTTIWSDSKIQEFKDWLKIQYEWIKSIEDPQPTIGEGCKWCNYVEVCPVAQDLIQNGSWDLVVPEDPTELDQDEMLTTLANVKAAKSLLDKKQRQMERMIKEEWMAQREQMETENWEVNFQDKERREYIPSEVQRIVGTSAFGQMAKVTNSGVERILPILPEDVADDVRRSAILKPYKALRLKRRGRK